MANVFISHRSADTAEATQLQAELVKAGHHAWLDTLEINVGDSIVEKINEGLIHSAYLILCYSSSGVMAPWISREWMSSLAVQLNTRGIKILPVRLTGNEIPALLEDIKYADLATDWNAGVAQLLRSIK